MTAPLEFGRDYTCEHGEPWGECPQGCVQLSAFAETILRRSDLANLPKTDPLIEGLISQRTAVVLFGPTGAGKTVLATGMACCVGTGTDWLGRPVAQTPVMYVVGEGAFGLDQRISAWEAAWDRSVGDDEVMFYTKPASLTDRGVWAEMQAEAKWLGARFVVLDTFSSLAPDADETKDAPVFTRRLSDLAAAIDGTAMVVHHPGWSDADRTRGGYQLEANVDEVLKLAGGPSSDLVELSRKKVKDGPAGAQLWLRRRVVNLGMDADGHRLSSVVMETSHASDRTLQSVEDAESVVRAVFPLGPASKAQIRDALVDKLTISRTSAYEHLSRLVSAGVLKPAGGTDSRPIYEVS